jgi:hypothetical protein
MTSLYRYLYIIFVIVVGSDIVNNTVGSDTGIHLYIDSSEGGDVSNRNVVRLKKYLLKNQCDVDIVIESLDKAIEKFASFIFSPLDRLIPENYSILTNIKVFNDEALSSSILVRNSTGISDIENLKGVRFALLNKDSVTGYQLPLSIFNQAEIALNLDKVTVVQSNTSAISLLLHKDVFAAAIATPLAKKWAKTNDLRVVATSDSVSSGALLVNKNVSLETTQKCLNAFNMLTMDNSKLKRVMKVFPAWVAGFSVDVR